MSNLDGRSILITGGTGSFGRAFIQRVLTHHSPARVAIFSRDELKQYELKQSLPDERLRFLLGDIRDRDRLQLALHGVDYVIHAAALKQVDTAEYNPIEYIRTNVLGSENVITASMAAGVKKVVALSTDKASSPVNLYGATKLTADKLFISGNHYSIPFGTAMSVVRYGNVLGSRGSVVPAFRHLADAGAPIPITDFQMTRFWITLKQAVDFVIDALAGMQGGELFVPKIPSMRVVDLARAIAPNSKLAEVGIRPGEKLHEEMISAADAMRTIEQSSRFVVMPATGDWGYETPNGDPVPRGFSYSSDQNEQWLSGDDVLNLLADGERP